MKLQVESGPVIVTEGVNTFRALVHGVPVQTIDMRGALCVTRGMTYSENAKHCSSLAYFVRKIMHK